MKFFIKYFFGRCGPICGFLRNWSHLLKQSLMGNFVFCAVLSSSSNRETTPIPSLLYWVYSVSLLVANRTCTEIPESSTMFWPRLFEKFPFSLYTSNGYSNFWEKRLFGSKTVLVFLEGKGTNGWEN